MGVNINMINQLQRGLSRHKGKDETGGIYLAIIIVGLLLGSFGLFAYILTQLDYPPEKTTVINKGYYKGFLRVNLIDTEDSSTYIIYVKKQVFDTLEEGKTFVFDKTTLDDYLIH